MKNNVVLGAYLFFFAITNPLYAADIKTNTHPITGYNQENCVNQPVIGEIQDNKTFSEKTRSTETCSFVINNNAIIQWKSTYNIDEKNFRFSNPTYTSFSFQTNTLSYSTSIK